MAGKLIAENRRARFDYFLEQTFEAGLALTGSEVKSLRVGRANIAGVGDDAHRRQMLLVDQLGQIINEGRHGIVAAGGIGAVAVAADVGGDDVIVAAQILGHPVPVAAVVAPTVQQDQRRGIGVSPVGVVQPQALRDEGL